MKKLNEMTGNERIAYRNIKGVFQWEAGGWYNCLQDDCLEWVPDTLEDAKNQIYDEALTDAANPGHYMPGRAPREMRFAGEQFCREVIDYLFSHDEDIAEISEAKSW